MVVSTFSCVDWTSVYLLWRNFISKGTSKIPCPFLNELFVMLASAAYILNELFVFWLLSFSSFVLRMVGGREPQTSHLLLSRIDFLQHNSRVDEMLVAFPRNILQPQTGFEIEREPCILSSTFPGQSTIIPVWRGQGNGLWFKCYKLLLFLLKFSRLS